MTDLATRTLVTSGRETRSLGAGERGARSRMLRLPLYLLLIAASVVSIIPFLWMVIASTHPSSELFGTPLPVLPATRCGRTSPAWRRALASAA